MFCRKRVLFESSKVSVFEKRGIFFNEKVSEKGYLFILENDHTSPLSQTSGGTGGGREEYIILTKAHRAAVSIMAKGCIVA